MSTKKHRSESEDLIIDYSILTMSDSRTVETDKSGAYLRTALKAMGHIEQDYRIIPDDPKTISEAFRELAKSSDLLITTGGTGISKRDSTIDIVQPYLEKELPGFGEIFRALSFNEVGAAAILSRATCGIYANCLIFCLPGSLNAVQLAADRIIVPEIKHLIWELRIK